jgi:predicted ribosomally synthesized peptide with SipW-like signal peptide
MSLEEATTANTNETRRAAEGRPRRSEVKASKQGHKAHRLLLTVLAVGGLSALVGLGTYSAFTATTTNTGNSITAGSVKIDQHTGATTLYSVSNQKPGDSTTKCVRVTYSGSLTASAVKLYVSAGITNGSQYNLEVDRGSGLTTLDNTMSCAGFSQSSVAYNGNLGSLGTAYGTGVDGKASAGTWATNDSVDYRFIITQNDDTTPNAHTSTMSSGSHTFTWEARS